MKIVVLGRGKSGTSALLHMIVGAFPECRPVHGGFKSHARERNRKSADPDASFVAKFTHNDRKGRSFDVLLRHIAREGYAKKIWVARDPRDNAVSDALFRWRSRHGRDRRQFRGCLDAVERKQRDPSSVSFNEIYRWTGDPGGPQSIEEMIESETTRYRRMCEFIGGLADDWLIFRYEDLVDQQLAGLSAYLGRDVRAEAELPSEDRVKARTKSYGDWRNWFVDEDVAVFEPIYSSYMNLVGYGGADWKLPEEPRIDPALASEYMKRIASEPGARGVRRIRNRVRRLAGETAAFFARRSG